MGEVAIYLLAAFHTGLIAFFIPVSSGRPENIWGRVAGSIILGLIWPISLLLHLYDLRDHATLSQQSGEGSR